MSKGLPRGPTIGARLRTGFPMGVVVAGPLATTGYLLCWFANADHDAVPTIVPARFWLDARLPVLVPGSGVVVAYLGLMLLGCLPANLAGPRASFPANRRGRHRARDEAIQSGRARARPLGAAPPALDS